MKKPAIHIKLTAAALIICLITILGADGHVARAYSPPFATLKVGLYYGNGALQSANLENATGYGSGYEFGYLDAQRNFVPIGASTSYTAITMMKDRNMVLSGRDYIEGTNGSVVIGCYHIQLNSAYSSYSEAKQAADSYAEMAFVKYNYGSFYVCIGSYVSSAAASAAISAMGISGCTVTSGTTNTVTVAVTGTDRILFEYDCGSSSYLCVKPVSTGAPCRTWFKNNTYYGAFQYSRPSGGNLSVISCVNINDYVKCVLPHEMGSNWPLEALKAQALCARSYGMYNLKKHNSSGFDVCGTEHCQMYGSISATSATTNQAADETADQYITYNGELCDAYFSSSDGGATENSENVWSETIPYLRGVIDPYEADVASSISGYSWKVTYTPAQLTQRLRDRGVSCSEIVSLEVTQYTAVGNVLSVLLKDSNGKQISIAKRDRLNYLLGVPSIRFSVGGGTLPAAGEVYVNSPDGTLNGGAPSQYAIGGDGSVSMMSGSKVYAITGTGSVEEVTGEDGSGGGGGSSDGKVGGVFTITGTGRGHNVGMSQWGAYSMAKYHNKSYRDIINFYFTGVTVG